MVGNNILTLVALTGTAVESMPSQFALEARDAAYAE